MKKNAIIMKNKLFGPTTAKVRRIDELHQSCARASTFKSLLEIGTHFEGDYAESLINLASFAKHVLRKVSNFTKEKPSDNFEL